METGAKVKGSQGYEMEGLRGLKALGVRDLSYKLAYLACTVTPTNARVRIVISRRQQFYVLTCNKKNISQNYLQTPHLQKGFGYHKKSKKWGHPKQFP